MTLIFLGGGPPCTKKRSQFFFVVQFFFRAFSPKKSGVHKLHQKVVFWLKKCEKFRIQHPIFFFSKKFHPTNAAEKAVFTKKQFFPKETVIIFFLKIPNFAKNFMAKHTHTQKNKIGRFSSRFDHFFLIFFFNFIYFFFFFIFFYYYFLTFFYFFFILLYFYIFFFFYILSNLVFNRGQIESFSGGHLFPNRAKLASLVLEPLPQTQMPKIGSKKDQNGSK